MLIKKSTVLLIFLSVCFWGCIPTDGPSPEGEIMSEEELAERNLECDLSLSFATTYYANREFDNAVSNYDDVIDLGCSERNAEDIFVWMGRAYIELGKNDSASYIFKKGMKFMEDAPEFLEIYAWNEGKLGNTENQIFLMEKLLSMDESNTKILEGLSDIYRDQGDYSEQLNILELWLQVDKTNTKATGEKKAAYAALGMDETQVDRDRWEQDPSNVQYGIDYANSLLDSGSEEDAISVLKELLTYDRAEKRVLKMLAETHVNLGNDNEALQTYQDLYKVNRTDYTIAIEISKLMTDLEDYSQAYSWSEKAIDISGGRGDCYYQRAEVLFETAESCSGVQLTFEDKIVYEFAYLDYESAVKKGYHRAKVRRDFVKENNITKSSDWFMRPESERDYSPSQDCYNWINRSIKRK